MIRFFGEKLFGIKPEETSSYSIDLLKRELDETFNELKENNSKISSYETEIDGLKDSIHNYQIELIDKEQENNQINMVLKQKDNLILKLKKEAEFLKEKVKNPVDNQAKINNLIENDVQNQTNQQSNEIDKQKREIDELKKELVQVYEIKKQVTDENKVLKEQISLIQSSRTFEDKKK